MQFNIHLCVMGLVGCVWVSVCMGAEEYVITFTLPIEQWL